MSAGQIIDPAVITYAFFIRRMESDTADEQRNYANLFRTHCEEQWGRLMKWLELGLGRERLPPFLSLERVRRDDFYRLVPISKWFESADRRAVGFLDPSVYGDFYATELGQAFIGPGDPTIFSTLKRARLSAAREPTFLGEACCLTGACPEGKEVAPQVLRAWGIAKTVGTPFRLGWLERPANALFPLAFLYSGVEVEEEAYQLLHSLTLIGLAFDYCRIQWTMRRYQEEAYPAAMEANRRALEALEELRRATHLALSPAEYREYLAALVVSNSDLVRRRKAIERGRDEVAVSRRNLERLLAELRDRARPAEDEFFGPCLDEYRLAQEQMGVDLRYLQRTLDEVKDSLLLLGYGPGMQMPPVGEGLGAGEEKAYYDAQDQVLYIEGRRVNLTPTEQALIELLCDRPGHAFSKAEISDALPDGTTDHAIEAAISRLRKKIEPDPSKPRYLLTDKGRKGYYTTIPKRHGPTHGRAGGLVSEL